MSWWKTLLVKILGVALEQGSDKLKDLPERKPPTKYGKRVI